MTEQHNNDRLYPINFRWSGPNSGRFTGRLSDGKQALWVESGGSWYMLLFDANGKFLEIQERKYPQYDPDPNSTPEQKNDFPHRIWEEWASETGAVHSVIRIREMQMHEPIDVWMLDEPYHFEGRQLENDGWSSQEAEELRANWRNAGQYVLRIETSEYWVDAKGRYERV